MQKCANQRLRSCDSWSSAGRRSLRKIHQVLASAERPTQSHHEAKETQRNVTPQVLRIQQTSVDNVGSGGSFEPERLFQQTRLPNQAESVSIGSEERTEVALMEKSVSDLDFFTELLAIQQNGPKAIGFFGTRNMGFMHQQLIEILSYAMVLTGNHIYTSGATGTNAAVIKGALRAEQPDRLTVILPQSKHKQPPESQELLQQVTHIVEMPQNDELTLLEASRICNRNIVGQVQQVICFAFHDSRLLLETCSEAKEMKKIVTLFFLD